MPLAHLLRSLAIALPKQGDAPPNGPPMGTVLYLDVDGVLQYAEAGQWRPRLEAEQFLGWAVRHFECRWLTAWARPNEELPRRLGLKVPRGIQEVSWGAAVRPGRPTCKADAIRAEEDWLWLDDQPSSFDLAELRRRGEEARLILVDPAKPFILLGQIRERLRDHLSRRPGDGPRSPSP